MITFTQENIDWAKALLSQAISKTQDKVKIEKLNSISEKLDRLGENPIKISIKEQDIIETNKVISELEIITNAYTRLSDISDVEQYDNIKKQMTSKLQYLSTYKDMFLNESSYLEDYLKKELRTRLIQDIMENDKDINNKKPSFTQADKLVDIDSRYLLVKEQVTRVSNLANTIKTKYDFYMKFWQMVFQSVSTASKEKYMSRVN
ncbi:MAG: hypothetical protein KC414_08050, partial [Romboutsia sp.]|nr:hypothetical protein [Romboutsia sp.]